jgi:hypothetical protein
MVKYLTQHTNPKDFFSELQENEIFMYSYLDFKWEDVSKLAEENNASVEYIQKGTDEYKIYGECAVRVIRLRGKIFEYKIASGEIIKIEARDEETAKLRLVEHLFKNNYVILKDKFAS